MTADEFLNVNIPGKQLDLVRGMLVGREPRRERVPDPAPQGFAALAPDLVVEVRSPSDRPGDTLGKVADWLSAGTRLVWVVDPERRLTHIYRPDGTQATVESLDGEDVLPGFSCDLAALL
ncbi:MAG TPA: Uma2 family endonuclease [Gemmatimonadales bacterium]|nr:Uma2 family endonuclease [Gemmatimonadales bacterium]